MIDPKNIVNDHYNYEQLQELIIFTICVAGKKASTIAPRVHQLFNDLKIRAESSWPLNNAAKLPLDLWRDLQILGIGCYKMKARAILELANKMTYEGLNLTACKVEDLTAIHGIGRKSAKAFVSWSRPDEPHAILDTHILKWLKEQGVENVPKATPGSKKQYDRLEGEFLNRVPFGTRAADFDLQIWKGYESKEAASQANTGVTTVYK